MPTKVICIANQKGGVGKTATAVSLAHGLLQNGRRILLIDLDPQKQSAMDLGWKPGSSKGSQPPALPVRGAGSRVWSVGKSKPLFRSAHDQYRNERSANLAC
jgi:cellulose biosynthesis protein BcsQ